MRKLLQPSKRPYFLTFIATVFIMTSVVVSCKKESIIKNQNMQSTENSVGKEVVTTVKGRVLHESGEPAANVKVSIGSYIRTTDNKGNFIFSNITALEKNAHVIATLAGNFVGHRTLMLTQGVAEFTIIRLMKKELSGTFESTTGGEIAASNGGKIVFASGSIMNDKTKVRYDGKVNVYAKWIDPSSRLLSQFMPGCLRGISANNSEQMLETYGMFAVELYDDNNNLLQILNGKTAQLKFPIPQSMMATAPFEVPMWYLDENIGLWKEEGKLTKNGNEYVGNASHFSFWNADLPGYIGFSITLQDSITGLPLDQQTIIITRLVNNTFSGGYTDAAGLAEGEIPPNENLKLEVVHECNGVYQVLKTVFFTTGATPLNYGVLPVSMGNNLFATINGTAVDINNVPLANSTLTAEVIGGMASPSLLTTNANGEFTYLVPICTPTLGIHLVAYDQARMMNSGMQTFTVVPGVQNIGTIQATGFKSEFVRISTHTNGVIQDFYLVEPHADIYTYYSAAQNQIQIMCNSNTVGIDWATNFAIVGPANINVAHTFDFYDEQFNGLVFSSFLNPIVANTPIYFSEYGAVVGAFVAARSTLTFQNLNNVSRVVDFRIKIDDL